jgi:hypothetical protein
MNFKSRLERCAIAYRLLIAAIVLLVPRYRYKHEPIRTPLTQGEQSMREQSMADSLTAARHHSASSSNAQACSARPSAVQGPGRFCTALVLMAMLLAPLVVLAEADHHLSVMTVPAVEGSEGPQVAVKWSGELPIRLEVGLDTGEDGFVETSPAIELTESMTLLPHPPTVAGKSLTWRVTDSQSRTLARTGAVSPTREWRAEFFGPGLENDVRAVTIYQGDLVVAGDFLTAGEMTVNRIARWDGTQWSALSGPSGTGMNNTVFALTVHDGDLIAGGFFTTAGGVTVNHIAR